MRRIIAATLLIAAALPSGASAKDDYALELCGRSGCKVVADPVDAAALSHAAEELGVVVPAAVKSPFFTIRYVPSTGRTYRLAESALESYKAGSEPRVVAVFDRATAGVEPFNASDDGPRWSLIAAIAGAVLAVAVVAKSANRRV